MTDGHHTPDSNAQHDAEAQLSALNAMNERSSTMQAQARTHFAKFATVLAVLIGAAHVVPTFFNPTESMPAFWTAITVCLVAILGLVFWYLRGRSATPAGGNHRYVLGLMGTFMFYGLAVPLWPHDTWYIAVLAGLVIALPLIIAAWWKRT